MEGLLKFKVNDAQNVYDFVIIYVNICSTDAFANASWVER